MALTSYSSPNNNYIKVHACHCEKRWTNYSIRGTSYMWCNACSRSNPNSPLVNVTDYVCTTPYVLRTYVVPVAGYASQPVPLAPLQ